MPINYDSHPISWYLYKETKIEEENRTLGYIQKFISSDTPIEFFCPICKEHTLLRVTISNQHNYKPLVDNQPVGVFFIVTGICQREIHDQYHYFFQYEMPSIRKIGQIPSNAFFDQKNFSRYTKFLSKSQIADLGRATGLASHSIGIGSLIYLRRVFESIIENEHQRAKESEGFDDELYTKSRMGEKIKQLQGYLPEFIVSNSEIYSIMSKTIHELSEDEALEYFPAIVDSMEYILEKYLEKEVLEEKEMKLRKAIQGISKTIIENGE